MAAILDFALKIYVPFNTFWYIFKLLLPDDLEIRSKRFHNYYNLYRVYPQVARTTGKHAIKSTGLYICLNKCTSLGINNQLL